MPGDNTVLSVKDLSVSFNKKEPVWVVKNLSFTIAQGATLAVVGESGSGKSLTALSLLGLLPPGAQATGEIILQTANGPIAINKLTTAKSWYAIRGKETGMIFQEPMSSLNPVMKIGLQLEEAIAAKQHLPTPKLKQKALTWLNKVKLPDPETIFHRYPHQLSGGQKQRVMIAMAMCKNPVLLIADEPTTALDVTVQQEIIKLMKELQIEYRTAMIFITHDLALASTITDEVMVMYKGESVEYGAVVQVFKNPQHPYTQALLACNTYGKEKEKPLPVIGDFLKGEGGVNSTQRVNNNKNITQTDSERSEPVLTVKNVTIAFAERKTFLGSSAVYFKAVDNVSFTMKRGAVTGLVGESGSGKSTLSRSIIGLVPINGGELLFDNKSLAAMSPEERHKLRRKVQMIFQDPYSSLNPRMTIGQILEEPLSVHKIVPVKDIPKETQRLLGLVQLPTAAISKYPHQFSGGQRQRIGIARALALKPELIICDEIVSALDVSVQAQILNLLKELQQEFRLSYLFISHDLSVVEYMSDEILIMHSGKIVERGNAAVVLSHPVEEYTQRLINASVKLKHF